MNVTTISTGTHATQAAVESITNVKHQQQTYKIEMLEDSLASDDDDDDLISSDGSMFDETELTHIAVQDDLANQLAAAGPVGVAAAAAIASSKKRKRQHSFETNPSVRKRQQNRLLRKLRGIIYEFTGRVGKQAVVLVATPGKPNTSYKVFGAKPLEDVVRNLKNIVMDELENALAQQAPPPPQEDPSLFELPPLIIDGIPTPVEKMTQAQLRAFIPLMLKYSTGRGKPGWGREATRPPWWPKELPWANVRMDARSEDDKQKISWTHALRKIVINCYKYHGREDLLPTFADEEEKVSQMISHEEEEEEEEVIVQPVSNQATTIQTIHTTNAPTNTTTNYTTQTVLSTIQNADGTVSLIQVDPNNPIITLPDGTTAQVQGVATLHQGEGGATIQTVQSLGDVNGHENMTVDLTEATVAQDGQIYITAEDGQGYPVSVSNMITLPVSASMYQSMMANIQQIHTNSDGTVCITPMQVDAQNNNNNNSNANTNTNNNNNSSSSNSCGNSNNSSSNNNNNDTEGNSNGNPNTAANATTPTAPQYQCYSIMAATPLATATAHRLLTNTALNQTQNLVNNLSSNMNSNNNSNISPSNIRCQIINASSLQQNSSQMNCQQQQQQQQQQNYLANVLQNATAKVFIANPTHLNLTAATNILNSNNNNNNDTTTNNNNNSNHNNNNNNGHIKIATAMPLPIVVAATTAQHTQSATERNCSAVGRAGGGVNNRKTGHKRRKQTFAKVIPIKIEENLATDAVNNTTNTINHNNNNNSGESLLNIQIVNTTDNSVVVAGTGNGGAVVGSLGNLRVGNRLVSVDVSSSSNTTGSQLPAKTIKLETLDN
ncbi:DNA-binding protein Ewg isoform X4 [Lucilia sericata]|uniref:DNA-binding protein Ewg isoform X4 n=1 Tax=Lucilia sericata TaxID=13632 RepID=UPI0018A87E33|nr:DNA-binding protein Ewg isoform X4 [Lucilia sericata]